jgi:hypothetical protein
VFRTGWLGSILQKDARGKRHAVDIRVPPQGTTADLAYLRSGTGWGFVR